MKKTNKIFNILVLVIPFILFSCSSGEKEHRGNDAGLRIKGFSLGMDFDTAKENAIRLFGEAGVTVIPSEEKKVEFNDSYQLIIMSESEDMSYMDLAADSERRLTRFSFHPRSLDLLFGLQSQDNDAIAAKVKTEFNLPNLTLNDSGNWEYREVEGISIKLQIKVSNRYFTIEGFVFD